VRTRFTKSECSHASNNNFVGEDGETFQWKITMSQCLSLPYKLKPTKPQGRTRKKRGK
jgi:hypothetical protein